MPMLLKKDNPLADTEIGKMIASGDPAQGEAAFQQIITSATINKPIEYLVDPQTMAMAWKKQVDAANAHYEPGVFTTLVGYEWSSMPDRHSPCFPMRISARAQRCHLVRDLRWPQTVA